MRNIALGAVLLDQDEADHVIFAVAAPEAHSTIWRRYGETVRAFQATDQLRFSRPPGSAIATFS
jgi:hypothetical protein